MKNIIVFIAIAALIACSHASASGASQQANSDGFRGSSIADLKLKGTLFTESLNPLAIIEHSNNGQIMMYELGDDVGGLRIVKITRGEIKLSLAGREYSLSFPGGNISQQESAFDDGRTWYNISRQGDIITTDQATVTGAILRARDILKDLKASPYSESGKRSGIAITSLNEIGVLKEIGIKEGDIIRSVNGFALNSPYQVFNAYRNLKGKQELKVEIIRQGHPLTITYRVKK
jgi:general secretion pathway protein C